MTDETATAINVPHVLVAINEVAEALSKSGILKNKETTGGQKFMFRGIDQVLNELATPLYKAGLRIIPKDVEVISNTVRETKNAAMYHASLKVTYALMSTLDGSCTTAVSIGEAWDSGDKVMGKAQSYAFKAMVFVTFNVPTMPERDADPDTTGSPHTDVEDPKRPIEQPKAKAPAPVEQHGTEPATAEPASKGLLSMVQKAMAAKGEPGSEIAKARLKTLGASKWSDLSKSAAAELLADLKAL